jgi:hypothetical protein
MPWGFEGHLVMRKNKAEAGEDSVDGLHGLRFLSRLFLAVADGGGDGDSGGAVGLVTAAAGD